MNSRYFLEEDAVNSEGKLVVEKQKSVNKIGHGQYILVLQISFMVVDSHNKNTFFLAALHELDPAFRKVTLENQRLKDLVTDLKFHKDPVGACSFFFWFAT